MAAPLYPAIVTLRGPGPDALPIDDTTPLVVRSSVAGGAISDTNPQPTKGIGFKAAVTITRPANTTAYNAGDAIGQADAITPANAGTAILDFASMGLAAGHTIITGARLELDKAALISGEAGYRLHLYDVAPDAVLDNAVFDLSSAGDRGKYLGFIDFRTPTDLGSTLLSQEDGLAIHRKLAGTSIFGVLQTIGGYTPTSGAVMKVTLTGIAA